VSENPTVEHHAGGPSLPVLNRRTTQMCFPKFRDFREVVFQGFDRFTDRQFFE
jgi:hypothetical protein